MRSAIYVKELADLYFDTFNEKMKVGCPSCYMNAHVRLKSYLYNKQKRKRMEKTTQFELSVSCIRKHNSRDIYTNDTLTDEIAIDYLRQNKARIVHFKRFPENWEELLVVKKTRKKKATKKKVEKKVEVEVEVQKEVKTEEK